MRPIAAVSVTEQTTCTHKRVIGHFKPSSSGRFNVTVTAPTSGGFLSVLPTTQPQVTSSNLNWEPGQTVSNLVSARVDANGYASFYNRAGDAIVIADVVGYYDDGSVPSPSLVTAVTPTRILDSRNGTGGYGVPWTAFEIRRLQVRGTAGVPADADTVFLNLTATNVTGYSFLAVSPTGVPMPNVSNLSLAPRDTRSVLVAARIGADGGINIQNWQGNADVVADVVAYARTASGNRFHSIAPVRALDTRTSGFELAGSWSEFQTRNLTVGGRFGVPVGATAVALNVTVAGATSGTFVRMYPAGAATGDTSTVNVDAGKILANMAMVKLGTGGQVSIYNLLGRTDLVIDVVGWYD